MEGKIVPDEHIHEHALCFNMKDRGLGCRASGLSNVYDFIVHAFSEPIQAINAQERIWIAGVVVETAVLFLRND